MNKLVSILIPAYNAEKWIEATIRSAVDQTWSNKEIIIIDDGSSDETLSIAKRFQSRAVKVLTQENRGACAARNHALSLAQGDYIQWLDADDELAKDKISQQLRAAQRYDALTLLSSSWARYYYRTNRAKFIRTSLWQNSLPADWLVNSFNENAWMGIESWLVSRKLTEMAGPWNELLLRDNDGEYFSRVICNSKEIKFIEEAKCYCRMGNTGSISNDSNMSKEKIESVYLSIYLQINYLRTLENTERTKAACLRHLHHNLIYFYPDQSDILEKAQILALALGGTLTPPVLRWQYSIIKEVLGWKIAKRVVRLPSEMRESINKHWDKLFYILSI